MAAREQVKVGRQTVGLSNLHKVFYPEAGFTKGDVIDYYARVASVVLPHLAGRPLTLKRYPDGVEGNFFYEKQCPSHRPDWIRTATLPSRGKQKSIHYCLVDSVEALVWAANLADLELHPSLAKAEKIDRPTAVAFDLDPGQGVGLLECAEVGLWLRAALAHLGLESFIKTSGSKGMQVYVPLNTPVSYEQTKPFAQALAQILEREHPRQIVSKMSKELRRKKVFIDWSQNDRHKTTVGVYSLRARQRPTVSTPVQWEEVEKALKNGRAESLVFEAGDVLKRLERHGDLFEPVLKQKQKLKGL